MFRNSWIENLRFSICTDGMVDDWQREADGRSHASAALQRDLAPHGLDEFARDIEAEARAARIGGQRVFETLKWFEKPGLLFWRDAHAMIAHRDL